MVGPSSNEKNLVERLEIGRWMNGVRLFRDGSLLLVRRFQLPVEKRGGQVEVPHGDLISGLLFQQVEFHCVRAAAAIVILTGGFFFATAVLWRFRPGRTMADHHEIGREYGQ